MLPSCTTATYQIVQTADTVMILVEMPHDVRMIHLDNKPLPAGLRRGWDTRSVTGKATRWSSRPRACARSSTFLSAAAAAIATCPRARTSK
jgi:hypothetical protein